MIEVSDVFLDDAVKMALAEDEEVVQALSAETPQESFADSVGFWSPDRRPQNLDESPLSDPVEGCLSWLPVSSADSDELGSRSHALVQPFVELRLAQTDNGSS